MIRRQRFVETWESLWRMIGQCLSITLYVQPIKIPLMSHRLIVHLQLTDDWLMYFHDIHRKWTSISQVSVDLWKTSTRSLSGAFSRLQIRLLLPADIYSLANLAHRLSVRLTVTEA